MMATNSPHASVHLIVPSGVRFCCSPPCYRACSADASALHFALFSNVQTARSKRARPAAIAAFIGVLPAHVAVPPPRPLPRAKATGKGGRQDKRGRHLSACNTCLHVGGVQHKAALPLCCLGCELHANTGMSACFARPNTP